PLVSGKAGGGGLVSVFTLAHGWPHFCFQALNDVGHGGFRLGHQATITRRSFGSSTMRTPVAPPCRRQRGNLHSLRVAALPRCRAPKPGSRRRDPGCERRWDACTKLGQSSQTRPSNWSGLPTCVAKFIETE